MEHRPGGLPCRALIAAFVSPGGALAIYGLLAVFYLFNHLPDPAALASASDPDSGEGVQD